MPNSRSKAVLHSIGANVRRVRGDLDLTQERLAEEADLDLRFLQRIERGTTNLSVEVLVALADALRVEPALLLQPAVLPPVTRGRPRKAAEEGSDSKPGRSVPPRRSTADSRKARE